MRNAFGLRRAAVELFFRQTAVGEVDAERVKRLRFLPQIEATLLLCLRAEAAQVVQYGID